MCSLSVSKNVLPLWLDSALQLIHCDLSTVCVLFVNLAQQLLALLSTERSVGVPLSSDLTARNSELSCLELLLACVVRSCGSDGREWMAGCCGVQCRCAAKERE